MRYTFGVNGKTYKTDAATIKLLRQFKAEGNDTMFGYTFEFGLYWGRIKEA